MRIFYTQRRFIIRAAVRVAHYCRGMIAFFNLRRLKAERSDRCSLVARCGSVPGVQARWRHSTEFITGNNQMEAEALRESSRNSFYIPEDP